MYTAQRSTAQISVNGVANFEWLLSISYTGNTFKYLHLNAAHFFCNIFATPKLFILINFYTLISYANKLWLKSIDYYSSVITVYIYIKFEFSMFIIYTYTIRIIRRKYLLKSLKLLTHV